MFEYPHIKITGYNYVALNITTAKKKPFPSVRKVSANGSQVHSSVVHSPVFYHDREQASIKILRKTGGKVFKT
jgi:hypothetical protein